MQFPKALKYIFYALKTIYHQVSSAKRPFDKMDFLHA